MPETCEAYTERARRFVLTRRCPESIRDDIVQEIVLAWLLYDTDNKPPPSMLWLYEKAHDKINPRTRINGHIMRHHDRQTTHRDLATVPARWQQNDEETLPPKGSVRAMKALHTIWGLTYEEIGWLWGVSRQRIEFILWRERA